jgi:hypothetical protein
MRISECGLRNESNQEKTVKTFDRITGFTGCVLLSILSCNPVKKIFRFIRVRRKI